MKFRVLWIALLSLLMLAASPAYVDAKPRKGQLSAGSNEGSGGSSKKSRKKKSASSSAAKNARYEVKPGDNLGDIAKAHGVRVEDLVRWNGLSSPDKIRAGQQLKIHTVSGSSASSKRTSSGSSQRKVIYVVRKGDTLSGIAKKNGVSAKQLQKWNRALKNNPDRLRVGQKVTLWVDAPAEKSSSVGKAFKGQLRGAEQLPAGKGYVLRNPKRAYGTNLTVTNVMNVMAKYDARYSSAPDFVIGDLSFETGGHMKPHKSHQSGRDIDIGYIDKSGEQHKRFVSMDASNFDVEKNWFLIKALLDTGDVEYIFVDYKLQKLLYEYAHKKGVSKSYLKRAFQYPDGKGSHRAIVRHARGHGDHSHVRFNCPKGDKACQ